MATSRIPALFRPIKPRCGHFMARSYHSYDHPSSSPYNAAQSNILSAGLSHVPEYGFVKQSLVQGCRDAGYLDTTHAGFPDGAFELIDEEEGHSIGKRVRRYCYERLKRNEPVISRWTEALALMALPQNASKAVEELAELSDEIWFLVGDKSSEFDWYTKRASLAAVYASTEMFMSQDSSREFRRTWEFLDHRLEDVYKAGAAVDGVSSWVAFTGFASINLLRSQMARS